MNKEPVNEELRGKNRGEAITELTKRVDGLAASVSMQEHALQNFGNAFTNIATAINRLEQFLFALIKLCIDAEVVLPDNLLKEFKDVVNAKDIFDYWGIQKPVITEEVQVESVEELSAPEDTSSAE